MLHQKYGQIWPLVDNKLDFNMGILGGHRGSLGTRGNVLIYSPVGAVTKYTWAGVKERL